MRIKEIDSKLAFKILRSKKTSFLIDVRSSYEWKNIGTPDLHDVNKNVLLIEWPFVINEIFIKSYYSKLINHFNYSDNLMFICKSGLRSMQAAKIAQKFGFLNIANIIDGFEGNGLGQMGWKLNDLPWTILKS